MLLALCVQQTLRFFWKNNLNSRKEIIQSLTVPCSMVLSMWVSPCWLRAGLPRLLLCLRLSLSCSRPLRVVLPFLLISGSTLVSDCFQSWNFGGDMAHLSLETGFNWIFCANAVELG